MRHTYHLLDVFTDRVFGGNPLAVFPGADTLSPAQMQRIAAELNLSETVFVLAPETAEGTRRLRIFTPAMELPFAGHPTVGTAILLAELGVKTRGGVMVLEEGAGPVPVTVRHVAGEAPFAQLTAAQRPEIRPVAADAETLARLLGIETEGVRVDGWAPAMASAGVAFHVIPVRDRDALGRARLDRAEWERWVADSWAPHVYVVTPDAGEGSDAQVRMFAPAMGIAEDPATGAAAAAFAGYLAQRGGSGEGTHRWTIHQGIEMGRPSTIHIEADVHEGAVSATRVGGTAVRVGEGWLDVPEA